MPTTAPCPLIPPLVAADTNLRDFPYVPLYRARLFSSAFHARATDAEWRAGVTLWLKSWDQVPAGSLPNDDRELSYLAELGRNLDEWQLVKEWALHGWELGDDNRLYHHTVAEGINEAWRQKTANRRRTAAAREKRRQTLDNLCDSPVTENVTALSQRPRERERDREEKISQPNGCSTSQPDGRSGSGSYEPSRSPPKGGSPRPRARARRRSPAETLFLGALNAAKAVERRDAERARSNGQQAAQPLLDK